MTDICKVTSFRYTYLWEGHDTTAATNIQRTLSNAKQRHEYTQFGISGYFITLTCLS